MRISRHPLAGILGGRMDSVPLDMTLIRRLETSFAQLAEDGNGFVARFYAAVFAAHPNLRRMFPDDMGPQRQKLLDMLRWVIETLRDPPAVRARLEALGQRHVAYGALPEHYPIIVATLVRTMGESLGKRWTSELELDWTNALQLVAEMMQRGAERGPLSP